jgi:hypothetical protein
MFMVRRLDSWLSYLHILMVFYRVKVKLFVVHEAYCLRLRNVYLFIVVFFKGY